MIINESIQWCTRERFHTAAAECMEPASVILDIGCGIRTQRFLKPDVLICVEPYVEYAEILKTILAGCTAIVINLDALSALRNLPERSVDSVFLIDVIEHMPKTIGLETIRECERVARNQIIIFTPLGYMPQEIHANDTDGWNLGGGEWQAHKSGWYPQDFAGWNIIACKHLHGEDHKGELVNPPYGGFYAIKNLSRESNQFNHVYAEDVLQQSIYDLDFLTRNYPQFTEKVVRKDISSSILSCGIDLCQRAAELFITKGNQFSKDEIFQLIDQERNVLALQESVKLIDRIRILASSFNEANIREMKFKSDFEALNLAINEREKLLLANQEACATKDAELKVSYLSLKDREMRALDVEKSLIEYERKLLEREKVVSGSKYSKIIRVIKAITK